LTHQFLLAFRIASRKAKYLWLARSVLRGKDKTLWKLYQKLNAFMKTWRQEPGVFRSASSLTVLDSF
jgi:hypothetical protein